MYKHTEAQMAGASHNLHHHRLQHLRPDRAPTSWHTQRSQLTDNGDTESKLDIA